jgi:hypothetical protein
MLSGSGGFLVVGCLKLEEVVSVGGLFTFQVMMLRRLEATA